MMGLKMFSPFLFFNEWDVLVNGNYFIEVVKINPS